MKTTKRPLNGKKKILIVDDHPLLREGLARIIDQQPDLVVCGSVGDAQQAMTAVKNLRPDLVVVDISLPGRDGLELTKDLVQQHAKLQVLVLSMHDEAVYAERALRVGARGYVMKREATEIHLRAIRQVLAGEIAVSNRIVASMVNKVSKGGSLSPVDLFSDRELEIFRLFGEGRSRFEIADKLHLSVKTIETHRTNACQKLGLRGAAEFTREAKHFLRDEMPPSAV